MQGRVGVGGARDGKLGTVVVVFIENEFNGGWAIDPPRKCLQAADQAAVG